MKWISITLILQILRGTAGYTNLLNIMALKYILELEFETRNSTLSDWNSNAILLEAYIEIASEF